MTTFDVDAVLSGWTWPATLAPEKGDPAEEALTWLRTNHTKAGQLVADMRSELKRIEANRELTVEGRRAASQRAREKIRGELEAMRGRSWLGVARAKLAELRDKARPRPPADEWQQRLALRRLDAALRADPLDLRLRIQQGDAELANVLVWASEWERAGLKLDADEWTRIDELAAERSDPAAFAAAQKLEKGLTLFTESLEREVAAMGGAAAPEPKGGD